MCVCVYLYKREREGGGELDRERGSEGEEGRERGGGVERE